MIKNKEPLSKKMAKSKLVFFFIMYKSSEERKLLKQKLNEDDFPDNK